MRIRAGRPASVGSPPARVTSSSSARTVGPSRRSPRTGWCPAPARASAPRSLSIASSRGPSPRRRCDRSRAALGSRNRSSDDRYSGLRSISPGLERRLRDLARPEVELPLDRVSGVLEHLRVHLRDDLVLGEGARDADDDRLLLSGDRITACVGCRRRATDRGDTERESDHRDPADGRARSWRRPHDGSISAVGCLLPEQGTNRRRTLALDVDDLDRSDLVPIPDVLRRRLRDQAPARARRPPRDGSRGSPCHPTRRRRTSARRSRLRRPVRSRHHPHRDRVTRRPPHRARPGEDLEPPSPRRPRHGLPWGRARPRRPCTRRRSS